MKSERISNWQSPEETDWNPATSRPGLLPADGLARLVDCVRAEAQVAPEAYLSDAIVPKGGE
jgi:hypothetical protein